MNKLLFFSALLTVLLVWYGESRRFFHLENGEYVTVWKTYNNVCYIVPRKYYGLTKPADNYIKTSNINLVCLYFSPALPKAFVIRPGFGIRIFNADTTVVSMYNYETDSARFNKLLFVPGVKGLELKPGVLSLDMNIRENYAYNRD